MRSKKEFKHEAIQTQTATGIGWPWLLLIGIAALAAIFAAWYAPKSLGDMFIALAGGRDVLAGKLGKPDDWSFTTQGRVWINQNWGSHLVIYLSYIIGKQSGVLALKAILIFLTGMFSVLAAMSRKVPPYVGAAAALLCMAASRNYFELRANITLLVMAPLVLWLIYRSFQRPNRIWWVLLAQLVWINSHGSHVFGTGMLFLWSFCMVVQSIIDEEGFDWKKIWQYPAAAVASVGITVVASPFGLGNLVEALKMNPNSVWVQVAEWNPVWRFSAYTSLGEFLVIMALPFLVGGLIWFVTQPDNPHKRKRKEDKPFWKTSNTGFFIFDLGILIVTLYMALRSQRFIPLAEMMIIPILAIRIWKAKNMAAIKSMIVIACVVAISIDVYSFENSYNFYKSNEKINKDATLFEDMHGVTQNFPAELAKFMADNKVVGNVLCDWTWEGFLKWNCPDPQMKLFVGGRAQQAYDEATYNTYMELIGGSPQTVQKLRENHVQLVAVRKMQGNAIFPVWGNLDKDKEWTPIYADGKYYLFADSTWEPGKAYIKRVLQGDMVYANDTISQASKAACSEDQPK